MDINSNNNNNNDSPHIYVNPLIQMILENSLKKGTNISDVIKKNKYHISVFQDESGSIRSGKWLFIGIFWIRNIYLNSLDKDLKRIRKKEKYTGEIHYNRFPKAFEGEYSGKARVARGWYKKWEAKWAERSWFNVFALDKKWLERKHFPNEYYIYNRFVAMALKTGYRQFYHKNYINNIDLDIYSHGNERTISKKKSNLKATDIDNFCSYIRKKLISDINTLKNSPPVTIKKDVTCVPITKKEMYSIHEELMQLTDLLLGATATAIEPATNNKTKMWFAEELAEHIEIIRQYPKERKSYRFGLKFFPDKDGKMYSDGMIKVKKDRISLCVVEDDCFSY